MSLKKEEFLALRDEILSLQNRITTVTLTLFTLVFSIYGLSISQKNPYIFFISYIVILVLGVFIRYLGLASARMSAYIRIFLADSEDCWEYHRLHILSFINESTNYDNLKKITTWPIFRHHFLIRFLLVVTTITIWWYVLCVMDDTSDDKCIWVISSVIFYLITHCTLYKWDMLIKDFHEDYATAIKEYQKKYISSNSES